MARLKTSELKSAKLFCIKPMNVANQEPMNQVTKKKKKKKKKERNL